jgi:hypothetical protein
MAACGGGGSANDNDNDNGGGINNAPAFTSAASVASPEGADETGERGLVARREPGEGDYGDQGAVPT